MQDRRLDGPPSEMIFYQECERLGKDLQRSFSQQSKRTERTTKKRKLREDRKLENIERSGAEVQERAIDTEFVVPLVFFVCAQFQRMSGQFFFFARSSHWVLF